MLYEVITRPAFGSHNIRTVAYLQALAQAEGLSPETCEFQMLFGMAVITSYSIHYTKLYDIAFPRVRVAAKADSQLTHLRLLR